MSVGILGGSFNPVHTDHLKLAQYVQGRLRTDRIVLLPNASPPHKNTCALGFDSRYQMLKAAIRDYEKFEISDLEKDGTVPHYSFNTIGQLKELYGHEKLFFIMGMDSLNYLDKWYRGLELTELCSLVVVQRKGYSLCDSNQAVKDYLEEYGVNESDDDFEEKLNSDKNFCFILNQGFNPVSSSALRDEINSFYKNFRNYEEFESHKDLYPLMREYLTEDIISYILQNGLYR